MSNKRIDQLVTSDPFKATDYMVIWSDNRTEKQTIGELTSYLQQNLTFTGGTSTGDDPAFISLSGDVNSLQYQIITGGTYSDITDTITLFQYGGGEILITGVTSTSTATTLSNLYDTNISSPQNGDMLIYKGGFWMNLSKVNQFFTPSMDNQTTFTNQLISPPTTPEKAEFWVNGVKQRYGINYDYVLSGGTNQTLVWVTNKHTLNIGDELNIKYF